MTATVPRLWPDATVVCIASGPSATQAQADLCRDRSRVIVVNDGYRLAPWADVLYACDAKWWKWHKGVPSFRGMKYSLQPSKPDVQILKNLGKHGLSLDPQGLKTGLNSGYQAINLAVLFGATRILLLGYDMRGGHFFGNHPDKTGPPFKKCLEAFHTLIQPLAVAGVRVVNCTPGSALHAFPEARLDQMLESVAA